MDKQVTLYTSWRGREQFYEGEPFTAFTETVRAHNLEFTVSEEHIIESRDNMRIIDTASDTEFV